MQVNPKAFVYSIPFDVGERKTTVTATHAIMVGKGNHEAPAAVVGMQIDYQIFREVTKNCNTLIPNESFVNSRAKKPSESIS